MRTLSLTVMLVATFAALPAGSWQRADAAQLKATVLGEGRPAVLLGGGLLGADGWGEVPNVLARTRRVINLQSLGVEYGLQGRQLPEGYSIQTEVDAARRTLDAMGTTAVDMIGMSHGGVVAIVLALQQPERIRTLTLIEPPAFWVLPNHGNDDEGALTMQTLLRSLRGRTIEDEHVERFRCLLGDCAGGRSARQNPQWPQWVKYRNSLRGLYTVADHRDDPARLREIRVPALIVSGAQSASFHREINAALLRALPHAQALELGAGHNSPTADPVGFVEAWQKFLDRANSASSR